MSIKHLLLGLTLLACVSACESSTKKPSIEYRGCELVMAETPRFPIDEKLTENQIIYHLDRYVVGNRGVEFSGAEYIEPAGCTSDLRAALEILGSVPAVYRKNTLEGFARKAEKAGDRKKAAYLRHLAQNITYT